MKVFTSTDDSTAFGLAMRYCQGIGAPVVVRINWEKYRLYPSGRSQRIDITGAEPLECGRCGYRFAEAVCPCQSGSGWRWDIPRDLAEAGVDPASPFVACCTVAVDHGYQPRVDAEARIIRFEPAGCPDVTLSEAG